MAVAATQEAQFDGAAASDLLGYSVALSGDRALVGAPTASPGGRSSAGSAFVYALAPRPQATGLFDPSSAASDGAGWRLLGAPVAGYTVADLAGLNLVQGVAAGANPTTHPAQYPNDGYNLLPTYLGGGSTYAHFPRPAGTDVVLERGRGFYWHLYDIDVLPQNVPPQFGTGTSAGRELTGFVLSATGATATADVQVAFSDNADAGDDDFQMLANPFARPLAVAGITTTGGALQGGIVQAYQPTGASTGTFVTLGLGGDAVPDVLAVWQGAMAELVPSAAGAAVTVTYSYAQTQPGTSPPFYGKTGEPAASVPPTVLFALAGTLTDGTTVTDQAAAVRFVDGAEPGWDALDASKLMPLASAYALVAPVGERDGAPYRLAVDSRPPASAAAVPVAFTATAGGTFTLSWTLAGADPAGGAAGLPPGWTAVLTDLATGQTVDLTQAVSYAFTTAGVAPWSERFVLAVTPAGIVAGDGSPAPVLGLSAPTPNPAAGRATLALTLPHAERVRVSLVDALGREVAVLADGEASGVVPLAVETAGLAAGVYTVRAVGAEFVLTRRLTVVR